MCFVKDVVGGNGDHLCLPGYLNLFADLNSEFLFFGPGIHDFYNQFFAFIIVTADMIQRLEPVTDYLYVFIGQ